MSVPMVCHFSEVLTSRGQNSLHPTQWGHRNSYKSADTATKTHHITCAEGGHEHQKSRPALGGDAEAQSP